MLMMRIYLSLRKQINNTYCNSPVLFSVQFIQTKEYVVTLKKPFGHHFVVMQYYVSYVTAKMIGYG